MREANERTLVVALVETATGIANVDAIMAVPGVNVGWLGHFDLTATMGITGQFEHPDFHAAVASLEAACTRYGKAAGILAGSLEMARDFRARAYRCIGYGTDLSLLQGALAEGLSLLRSTSLGDPSCARAARGGETSKAPRRGKR